MSRRGRQALAGEGAAAQPARAVRLVADDDAAVEQHPLFLAAKEARPARDRGARDRAEQMADNAASDSGVEDDRQLDDRRLAGVQPRDRREAPTSQLPSLIPNPYAAF